MPAGFTTFTMNQSRSLGERMSRTIASSSAAENAFGLHTRVARRRAAVSPVARSSKCEVVLRLEPLGEGAKVGEIHAMIVAVALVRLAHPRVLKCGELAYDIPDGCAR